MDQKANVGAGRGRGRGRGRVIPEKQIEVTPMFKSFAEPEAGSSYPSGSLEVPKDEKELIYLAHGFLDPAKITIPALSDSIKPGDERRCFLYTMKDTKSMSLHLAENFFSKVDDFIAFTGWWYENQIRNMKDLDINVKDDQLLPGAVVVVCHKEKGRKEWKRAKILEGFNQPMQGRNYTVLLLDLGEEVKILPLDIYYMHRSFVEQPQFAIKTQIHFNSNYEGAYPENYGWNYKFCQKLLTIMLNKEILVKFIRKAGPHNNQCWEVSLLTMKKPPKGLSSSRPIEQYIIEEMMPIMGSYVD